MITSGKFEVKMDAQPSAIPAGPLLNFGRFALSKTFYGSLEGSSQGEMLTAMSPVKGSAGYVAIECFTGTLEGKKGSFAMQHFGMMGKGEERLVLEVVTDSGTEELTGLSGTMQIIREGGGHEYRFEFEI